MSCCSKGVCICVGSDVSLILTKGYKNISQEDVNTLGRAQKQWLLDHKYAKLKQDRGFKW